MITNLCLPSRLDENAGLQEEAACPVPREKPEPHGWKEAETVQPGWKRAAEEVSGHTRLREGGPVTELKLLDRAWSLGARRGFKHRSRVVSEGWLFRVI